MFDKPYFVSLAIVSGFASASLFSIWRHIVAHSPVSKKKDLGLVYLAAAMGIWMVVGLWGSIASAFPRAVSVAVFSMLSTANSLLYLLAVQHFDYAPEQMRRRWWQPAVIVLGGVTAITTVLLTWESIGKNLDEDEMSVLVNLPDVLFSIPATVALSAGFWRSFYYRGYTFLAWLSLAAMAVVWFVQVPEVLSWLKSLLGETEHWLTLGAYSILMMFCFALAASWGVEELSMPQPEQIHLTIDGIKDKWQIHFRVREQRFTALMSHMAFKNFLLFVVARIEHSQNGWVHIEDKLNGGYVDFRRVLSPIGEAWKEADSFRNAEAKVYLEKVRRILFEYQNPGQYRLRAGASNWEFSAAFFAEQDKLVGAMSTKKEKEEVRAMFQLFGALPEVQDKALKRGRN